MKIIVTSIGTRGDMEPFLAIGEMLQKKGHEVICLFPEQFRNLVVDAELRFASLGSEFIEMLESETGITALGGKGKGFAKIRAFIKLASMQGNINKAMVRKQFEVIEEEKPDRIIHNGKAMYPVIWEVNHPGRTIFLSPIPLMHYVKGHTHVAFNSNYGEFLNKLTFKLADWGLIKTIMASMKWLQVKGIDKDQIKTVIKDHKIVYTISSTLFSRPKEWKANMDVMGYIERNKMINWQPDQDLTEFIERHPKILFITFGSMLNPEPARKTRIILGILKKNKIPAIINTAAGGLEEPDQYNDALVYFVSQIPYDWIFPKVYGVVHHGGSGTTHLAIKNGCASMIIPHIIDQHVWNRIIYEKGLGPRGIKIAEINEKNLEPKLLDLFENKSFKQQAEKFGKEMVEEDKSDSLLDMIIG